jgi:hypothetical protein
MRSTERPRSPLPTIGGQAKSKYPRLTEVRHRIRRHERNGVERRHLRINLCRTRGLLGDQDRIALWLDRGIAYRPRHQA